MDDLTKGLAEKFTDFARAFSTGAPLYSRLAERVAQEPAILELMSAAPPMQRIPVLLFASVHYLLRAEPDHPLARHYPNFHHSRTNRFISQLEENHEDSGDAFLRFVLNRSSELRALLATRSTQTNEIGRCNWFFFAFEIIEQSMGPIAHLDIGSSAGLTLLFPHLTFDFRPGGVIGDGRALTIHCEVRGEPPVPNRVPQVVWSMGIDASPIDIHNDEAVRWLEACVWPDQVERFDRLIAAVALARQHHVQVERGDAIADVAQLIDRAKQHGHPVITTSWVMNYLTPSQRRAFVSELDRIGFTCDFSWVIAESRRETPELPVDGHANEDITVISLVTWRKGQRLSRRLATTHPHGAWINWGV